jgi:ATP-binding cassette subfamily B multidrug efflux pump
MFRLHFTPNFRKQKNAMLSLHETPDIRLPEAIEAALRRLETAEVSAENSVSSTRDLWRVCLRTGKPIFKRVLLSSCLASFCATGAALIAVNLLRAGHSFFILSMFALAYFGFNTIGQFGNFFTNRLRAELSLASKATLTALISRKILNLNAESALKQSSGNLKVLITSDVDNIAEFLTQVVRNLIPALISILIMAPFLIHFSGRAGWIGLATLFLIIPIAIALNQVGTYFQAITQAKMDLRATLIGEWVKNIRLVRFLSWDESFEARNQQSLRNVIKPTLGQHVIACLVFGLSTSWWMLTGASVLGFAKIYHYPLKIEGFFGSLWLLTFIAGHFTHLPNTIRLFGIATPSMKRISKLLSEKEQRESFSAGSPLTPNAKPTRVLFDRVSFRYPSQSESGPYLIHNLTVEIRLAQKTAILGVVGSGKTTFLKLLCGEFPPTEGTIWIEFEDGSKHSLWEVDAHARFREQLAVVPQTPYVSSDRLSTNISLATLHEEDDLLRSIQKAELLADVDQFSDRLNQMLGESGVNLSGGQRQRLNLARAFHSKRPYLVLDDTLSAVDAKTEATLMENLCVPEAGILLVTHRLSEIKRLGYVLVFQNGNVIEAGQPEILASKPNSAFTRALEAYSHE